MMTERALVAEDGLEPAWADLHRMVMRLVAGRVPAADADDVVQTTLCAAFASPDLPRDPEGRLRWLTRVARHKIADYYRGRARDQAISAEIGLAPTLDAMPVSEARELLEAVVAEAQDDQRKQETLRWIVREYQGERLTEIAERDRVEPATVRQRVSRLRRQLRARWWAVAAAVSLGTLLAWWLPRWGASPALPAGTLVAPSLSDLEGSWRVVAVTTAPGVDTKTRALAEPLALGARAAVGKRLEVEVAGKRLGLVLVDHETREDALALTYVDAQGRQHEVTLQRDGERLRLATSHQGWRGELVLERAEP
ncbi:MAG: RNA polymerase sigma factor [Polyangiaceae bacterium]